MNRDNRAVSPLSGDALLRKIQEVAFAMVECELYLDGYPECQRALEYYQELAREYEALLSRYEGEIGPIRHENIKGERWSWVDTPWPWQTGGEK